MSFFKPSPLAKVEPPPPPPTRDTAADALQQQEEEAKKRRAALQGMTSTMLTGAGGVATELTGTRTMTNG
jgi:hypothetical protein